MRKIPNATEEALALDKENGDTLWYDVIIAEGCSDRDGLHR